MSIQISFIYRGKLYKIDKILAGYLNSFVYNLAGDNDIVILITGDRQVRVGKSVLAMTCAAYLGWALKNTKFRGSAKNDDAYNEDNVFMTHEEILEKAQKRSKYSVLQYDEAREGFAASKTMQQFQQNLIDYMNECGQLNHIWIIVCPDFFELKEFMAVPRSEILINVFRRDVPIEIDLYGTGEKLPIVRFQKGSFEIFNRQQKDSLYQIAKNKRYKTYRHVKPAHTGTFADQYPLPKEWYIQKKKDSLSRFNERHKNRQQRENHIQRNKYIVKRKIEGVKTTDIILEIEKYFEESLSERQIRRICKENEDMDGHGDVYTSIPDVNGENGEKTA